MVNGGLAVKVAYPKLKQKKWGPTLTLRIFRAHKLKLVQFVRSGSSSEAELYIRTGNKTFKRF